jgi:hypothetical protein
MRASSRTLSNRRSLGQTPASRGGLVHYSDRGVQYLSIEYTERLAELELSLPSAASTTLTTTPSPKRSTFLQGGGDCCAVSRIDAAAGFTTSNML